MKKRRRSSVLRIAKGGEGLPLDPMTKEWGDAAAALAAAPVRIEAEYKTPREYNVPIEPHGLIAKWDGDKLILWEPSQWIDGMARTYAEWFGIPFENVRMISPYIGGGFGSKAFALPHGAIGVMAAKMVGRPVKLVDHPAADLHLFRRPAGHTPDDRARCDRGWQAAVHRP